jgi:glycosyltransferase involved in cell wall biosynthesis
MSKILGATLLILSPSRLQVSAKNLLLWRRLKQDPQAWAIWEEYFEAAEYCRLNPDVLRAKIEPALHFLLRGNEEYRNSSSRFDIRYYLEQYPDVEASRVNALMHFALFGARENRTFALPTVEDVLETRPIETQPGPAPELSSPPLPVLLVNNDWRRELPLVSVVIPCFNYGHFVEQAIRSVLAQTFQNFEIIVVEGGSTDPASVDELRLIEALGLPKTRFYYRSERHLAGDNRNFGIGWARGRYICCLDADDLLRPVYLEVAVFLVEVLGYDLVSSSVECFGESAERWLVPEPRFPDIMTENQVATAALFRRSAWAHVGGIRDWGSGREYVFEDWDFWIRLLGHGFKGKSIREPLLLYRVHPASLTNTARPELKEQRERLQAANADLRASAQLNSDLRRAAINPTVNLGPIQESQQGFLLALPFVAIGGAEKLFRTIAQAIVASGRRLVVITSMTLPESIPDDSASFESITPHVYRLSELFSDDECRRDFLRYLISRYSIQTLMAAGCEFVYHLLPQLVREFPELAIVDQLFNDTGHVLNNRRYSAAIDATVVPSEQLAQSLLEQHPAEARSIHVIPHGIRLPEQEPGLLVDALPAAARGKVIVAFFGRLSPEKAPDLFVEIARELMPHSDLFFLMTGEGPERENVLAQIRKYKLGDRIFTPGFVEDVLPLMRAADIMVLPSRIDGMPLAVLECQALGKPVVASRVGSLPVMIEDQKTGFLCDPGDVPAFCANILRLARDPDLRRRMQVVARQSVARKYSVERMLAAYEAVFQAVGKNPQQSAARVGYHDAVR